MTFTAYIKENIIFYFIYLFIIIIFRELESTKNTFLITKIKNKGKEKG